MKLTVKDLMINDWARCHYINKLTGEEVIKDFQVTAVMLESFSHHESIWSKKGNMGKELEPIPLTAEILEKNGWKHYPEDEERGLMEHCVLDYVGNAYFFSAGHIEFEIMGMRTRGRLRKELQYVHELQHALCLCGLNDLADNFKI